MASNGIKALKSGVWYTFSNFLLKGIGIITIPIFTRILTKAEYGLYNNFISWKSIMSVFITLNLSVTLGNAKYDFKEKFDEYILSVLMLSSLSVVVWNVIINCFQSFFSDLFGMDYIYINAMMIYLFFTPVIEMFQARERFSFEYKKSVLISIIVALTTSILSVILVMLLQNKLSGKIFGEIIPTVLIGFVLYIFFLKKGKRIVFLYWKYALKIGLPYIPHTLSLIVLSSMDRTMIRKWCGAEDTAMYSIAYTCTMIISLLINSIGSAYGPWLAEKLYGKNYKTIRSYSKLYMIAFASFIPIVMLIAPELLLILGGWDYLGAMYVIPPVAMGCVCQFIYTIFGAVEQLEKKTIGMAFASVSAALLNYILNCIFIPRWGYISAAYTTLVGYIWLMIVYLFMVWKIGLRQVYSYRFVLFLAAILFLCMAIANILYANTILRYLFLLGYLFIMLFVCFKNRYFIAKVFNMIKGKST